MEINDCNAVEITASVPESIKVRVACEKFLAANTHLCTARLKMYRLMFDRLNRFLQRRQTDALQDLTLDLLTDFRAEWHTTWKHRNGTIRLNIQLLRKLFRFCIKRDWVQKNPACDLETPRVNSRPTLPFRQEEWDNILRALASYNMRNGIGRVQRLYAFVLLLRYSGMRIGDAVRCETMWIEEDRISFLTQKNHVQVRNKLPKFVLKALWNVPHKNERHFFWSGNSTLQTAIGNWQGRLQILFRLAGIRNGHAHRFRDTYAFDLAHNGGMTLEELRQALGHKSTRTTEKYYSHWLRERQERFEAKQDSVWASHERCHELSFRNGQILQPNVVQCSEHDDLSSERHDVSGRGVGSDYSSAADAVTSDFPLQN
jgi:integrase/recombinase XerD